MSFRKTRDSLGNWASVKSFKESLLAFFQPGFHLHEKVSHGFTRTQMFLSSLFQRDQCCDEEIKSTK